MTTTDIDTTVLEALDFELPCDLRRRSGNTYKPCPQPAAWIVELKAHCPETGAVTRLICEPCYQHLTAGGTARCKGCDTSNVVMRDFVLRLERIKP